MILLPDTNAITGLRLGNEIVLNQMEYAEAVLLSVIVLGELRYGYRIGSKEAENLIFLSSFLGKPRVEVLGIGDETAEIYAALRFDLKRLGRPIPTNDLWITAQTIEKGAVLLSNDRHFGDVTGLRYQRF